MTSSAAPWTLFGIVTASPQTTAAAHDCPQPRIDRNALISNRLSRRERWIKRGIDLLIAVPLGILVLPLLLLVAAAIKLDSRGPVFFRQQRFGLGFEPFTMVKFRSLQHAIPNPSLRYETQEDDPRITRVGAILRRTSLDEIPQVFQVIGGAMSLVGPRPLVEWESRESLAEHAERYQVKPGITGLSQVSVRNSAPMDTRLAKDVEYVHRWSIMLDLRILLRTPLHVMRCASIYPKHRSGPGRR